MIQAAFLMTVMDMVSLHRDQWSDRKRIFTWGEEMAEPGPRNLITDVPDLLVGQAEDSAALPGATVVLWEAPAVASVDVRGGAPGTRETELLGPATLVDRVDAIVLSGGSAFGYGRARRDGARLRGARRARADRAGGDPVRSCFSWAAALDRRAPPSGARPARARTGGSGVCARQCRRRFRRQSRPAERGHGQRVIAPRERRHGRRACRPQ